MMIKTSWSIERGAWSISPRVGVRRENFHPNLLRFMMFSIPCSGREAFALFSTEVVASGSGDTHITLHICTFALLKFLVCVHKVTHSSCTPTYLPLLIKKSTTILYRDEARSLDPLALSLPLSQSVLNLKGPDIFLNFSPKTCKNRIRNHAVKTTAA